MGGGGERDPEVRPRGGAGREHPPLHPTGPEARGFPKGNPFPPSELCPRPPLSGSLGEIPQVPLHFPAAGRELGGFPDGPHASQARRGPGRAEGLLQQESLEEEGALGVGAKAPETPRPSGWEERAGQPLPLGLPTACCRPHCRESGCEVGPPLPVKSLSGSLRQGYAPGKSEPLMLSQMPGVKAAPPTWALAVCPSPQHLGPSRVPRTCSQVAWAFLATKPVVTQFALRGQGFLFSVLSFLTSLHTCEQH